MKRSDFAIEKLIDLITVQKRYCPGDKLPNEAGLSEDLGVSRNTVRTAVRYLVGQGVLEIRIGKGTYVAESSKISADYGFDQLQFLHLKIHDLYELRLMLEPQIAYFAALRATDQELETIQMLDLQLQKHVMSGCDDAHGNQLFHDAIAKATHNEFTAKLSGILNEALVHAFSESGLVQTIDDFSMDHRLIVDYLMRHDAEGAKMAMDLHMKNSIKCYQL